MAFTDFEKRQLENLKSQWAWPEVFTEWLRRHRWTQPTQPQSTTPQPQQQTVQESSLPVIDFIKKQEWFSGAVYDDFKQKTIWFWTAAKPWQTSITEDQALKDLQSDVQRRQAKVTEVFWTDLTEWQKTALTSFMFNLGVNIFDKPTSQRLKNAIIDWDEQVIREEFVKFNKAWWKVLPWLTKRREEELAQFFSDIQSNQPEVDNTAVSIEWPKVLTLDTLQWVINRQSQEKEEELQKPSILKIIVNQTEWAKTLAKWGLSFVTNTIDSAEQTFEWLLNIWNKAISQPLANKIRPLLGKEPLTEEQFIQAWAADTVIQEDLLDIGQWSLMLWLTGVFPVATYAFNTAWETIEGEKVLNSIWNAMVIWGEFINKMPGLSDFRDSLPEHRQADFDAFIWQWVTLWTFKAWSKLNEIKREWINTNRAAESAAENIIRPTRTEALEKAWLESSETAAVRGLIDTVTKVEQPAKQFKAVSDLTTTVTKEKQSAWTPLKKWLDDSQTQLNKVEANQPLKWKTQDSSIQSALDQLVDVFDGVTSKSMKEQQARIRELKNKHETEWLTLTELQEVKNLHTSSHNLFTEKWDIKWKTFNAKDARWLRNDIKILIEERATKWWLDDGQAQLNKVEANQPLKWKTQDSSIQSALDQLVDVFDGVTSKSMKEQQARIRELKNKHETEWLTLTELQEVKNLHTSSHNLFIEKWDIQWKTFNAKDARWLRNDIKILIEERATKWWVANIAELNRRYWDLVTAETFLKIRQAEIKAANAKTIPKWFIESVVEKILDLPVIDAVFQWALRWIFNSAKRQTAWGNKISVIEMEAMLPNLIKEIRSKKWQPTLWEQTRAILRDSWFVVVWDSVLYVWDLPADDTQESKTRWTDLLKELTNQWSKQSTGKWGKWTKLLESLTK